MKTFPKDIQGQRLKEVGMIQKEKMLRGIIFPLQECNSKVTCGLSYIKIMNIQCRII